MRLFPFCVIFCLATTQALSQSMEMESQVTWITAGQPEVHVLMKNTSATSINFFLMPFSEDPDLDEGFLKCGSGDWLKWAKQYDSIGWRPSGEYVSTTSGRLPPGGWAYRVVFAGGGALAAGCTMTLRLIDSTTGKLLRKHEVLIPRQMLPGARDRLQSLKPGDLSIDHLVERDLGRTDLLIRLRVRNNSPIANEIAIVDEKIKCQSTVNPASWNWMRREPPQPLMRGPVEIPAKGWFVFTVPVREGSGVTEKGVKPASCVAEFEFGSAQPAGDGASVIHVVPLREDGFLGRG